MTETQVKISFGITVKDEGEYISDLLNQLVPYCDETGDEIVVVDDNSTDEYTLSVLESHHSLEAISLYQHELNNDFATHKNFLNSKCTGDYIFQIDADETLHPTLLKYLHDILGYNANIDLFMVPRVNVVNGITDEDIQRWGWTVNEFGWVMFPDFQSRLYRNASNIKWEGKVHERITGHKLQTMLPAEEEWAIYHIKDIERQRKQNEFYTTIST